MNKALFSVILGNPNRISNGNFPSDISGWTSVPGWVNGTWTTDGASVTPISFLGIAQAFRTIPGIRFRFVLEIVSVTGTTGRVYIGSATAPSNSPIVNQSGLSAGLYSLDFTATASLHAIGLSSTNGAGTIVYRGISAWRI